MSFKPPIENISYKSPDEYLIVTTTDIPVIITGSAILTYTLSTIYSLYSSKIEAYLNIICLEEAIEKISCAAKEGANCARLYEDVLLTTTSLGLPNELRYYILICGIFTPERNIVKHWPHYEKAFLDLISVDGKIGIKHLF